MNDADRRLLAGARRARMGLEAIRRNAVVASPVDRWDRIAVALERIADALEREPEYMKLEPESESPDIAYFGDDETPAR